jgi:hypothetical protein
MRGALTANVRVWLTLSYLQTHSLTQSVAVAFGPRGTCRLSLEVARVFQLSQRLMSSLRAKYSDRSEVGVGSLAMSSAGAASQAFLAGPASHRAPESPRELPDVTGFLVVVIVTLGLFVVPVGATIMQGPAIVASILGR